MIYIYYLQLLNIGSNYNYGPEEHTEYLCVVSRDVHDSMSTSAPEKQPSKVCIHPYNVFIFYIYFILFIRTSTLMWTAGFGLFFLSSDTNK